MEASQPSKPIPIPDEASAPFFEGARRHELMLLRCRDCGTFMWPGAPFATTVRSRCINCYSGSLEWTATSGRGAIYSFAIMHQVYDPAFAEEVPYNVTIVDLEEGVRMTSNIVDCPNDELEVGTPVEVVFEDVDEQISIPRFRRRSAP